MFTVCLNSVIQQTILLTGGKGEGSNTSQFPYSVLQHSPLSMSGKTETGNIYKSDFLPHPFSKGGESWELYEDSILWFLWWVQHVTASPLEDKLRGRDYLTNRAQSLRAPDHVWGSGPAMWSLPKRMSWSWPPTHQHQGHGGRLLQTPVYSPVPVKQPSNGHLMSWLFLKTLSVSVGPFTFLHIFSASQRGRRWTTSQRGPTRSWDAIWTHHLWCGRWGHM